MKLAMITSYATTTNVRRELLLAASERGHEVTVISPGDEYALARSLAEIDVEYIPWHVERVGIDPVSDLRACAELLRGLRTLRPDVVLIYQIKAMLLAPTIARLAGVQRVVGLVNGLGATFDSARFGRSWTARLARRAYGLSLRNADFLVFQNHDDPQLLASLGLLNENAKIAVVPGTGVNLDAIQPLPAIVEPMTFTLISRLLVSKGVREFAESARRIKREDASTRFVLVGQLEAASHPDAISRTEIAAWEREGLVEYLGFSSDIRAVLALTSVFVLPSYYREGVPRTNLEALAAGRPVVTTDWVGCRETVRDGENGFLVPPRDPSTLTDRLRRYVRDPSLVALHGVASRRLAEQRFDIVHVNELMLAALEHSS